MEGVNRTVVFLVGVGVVVVGVIAYFYPKAAAAAAKAAAVNRCDALKSQRAVLAVQGTDPVTIARLDAEIQACQVTANIAGASYDLGDEMRAACEGKGTQINQEWLHYKSTGYDDVVKRNNTRASILRFGEEMAFCYQNAADATTTIAGADALIASIRRDLGRAEARANEYTTGALGTGRFAFQEDNNPEKAQAEKERVITPLRIAHEKATKKRAALILARAAASASTPNVSQSA